MITQDLSDDTKCAKDYIWGTKRWLQNTQEIISKCQNDIKQTSKGW